MIQHAGRSRMQSERTQRSQNRGFTLVEVMVAVVVIALLAAIAYPSYVRWVQRSHETAAQSLLLRASNLQERFLLDRRQYASSLAELGLTTPSDIAARYSISMTASATGSPTYTITATPIGQQADMSTLEVKHDGTKSW